jgi:hypothetical protein
VFILCVPAAYFSIHFVPLVIAVILCLLLLVVRISDFRATYLPITIRLDSLQMGHPFCRPGASQLACRM